MNDFFMGLGKTFSAWNELFPAVKLDKEQLEEMQQFMPDFFSFSAGEYDKNAKTLPENRIAKYSLFDEVCTIGLVNNAITTLVNYAVGKTDDDKRSVKFTPKDIKDKEAKKIVDFLNENLTPKIDEQLEEWAYNILKYGIWMPRIYVEKSKGISRIVSDSFTHPRLNKIFEVNGETVGFLNYYDYVNGHHFGAGSVPIKLAEPWKFVPMRYLSGNRKYNINPNDPRVLSTKERFSISADDPWGQVVETDKYGISILESAFKEIQDFKEALNSLLTQRKSAARRDVYHYLQSQGMDPTQAAKQRYEMVNRMLEQEEREEKQYKKKGLQKLVRNWFINVFGDKGKVDTVIAETPEPTMIEDVLFHARGVGAALGVDISALGFADQLAASLGDGSVLQVSLNATDKAIHLRKILFGGINQIARIACFMKFGKVFPEDQQFWDVEFPAYSATKEAQETQNTALRMQTGTEVLNFISSLQATGVEINDPIGLTDKILLDIIKKPEWGTFFKVPKKKPVDDEGMEMF